MAFTPSTRVIGRLASMSSGVQRHAATMSLEHRQVLAQREDLDFELFCELYQSHRAHPKDFCKTSARTDEQIEWVLLNERRVAAVKILLFWNPLPSHLVGLFESRWGTNQTIRDAVAACDSGPPELMKSLWSRLTDKQRFQWACTSNPDACSDDEVRDLIAGDMTFGGGLKELVANRPGLVPFCFTSENLWALLLTSSSPLIADDELQAQAACNWGHDATLDDMRAVRSMALNPRIGPRSLRVLASNIERGSASWAEIAGLLAARLEADLPVLTGDVADITCPAMLERVLVWAELTYYDSVHDSSVATELARNAEFRHRGDLVDRLELLLRHDSTETHLAGAEAAALTALGRGVESHFDEYAATKVSAIAPIDYAVVAAYLEARLTSDTQWCLVLDLLDTYEGTLGDLVDGIEHALA